MRRDQVDATRPFSHPPKRIQRFGLGSLGAVRVIEKIHPRGTRIPRHRHDKPYLTWSSGGPFRETIAGSGAWVDAGSVITNFTGEAHSNDYTAVDVRCVVVELERVHPPSERSRFYGPETPVARLARRIDVERAMIDVSSSFLIDELLLELVRHRTGRCNRRPAVIPPAWIRRIKARADDCFRQRLSLTQYAEGEGRHPDHLTRVFKAHYGVRLGDYLRLRRLDWAAVKLALGLLPLAEIAYGAGFSDQSHFTRQFRRRFGVTPGHYRSLLSK